MKLFILIACLLIERYLHIGGTLRRFSWFEGYLALLQRKIGKDKPMTKGFLGVVVAVLPLCIPVGVLYALAVYLQFALSGVGMYFLILLYCFGPNDLFNEISLYFRSIDENDEEHQVYSYAEITGSDVKMDASEVRTHARKITEAIFLRANCSIFAIIFWFWVGGVIAVVIYRLVCLMAALANQGNEICDPVAEAAIRLYGWLNWLPARVTALCYSIAGGSQAYAFWRRNFWSNANGSQVILVECGVNSIVKNKELSYVDENRAAVALIDRALIIFIVVMLVFALGAWLN